MSPSFKLDTVGTWRSSFTYQVLQKPALQNPVFLDKYKISGCAAGFGSRQGVSKWIGRWSESDTKDGGFGSAKNIDMYAGIYIVYTYT